MIASAYYESAFRQGPLNRHAVQVSSPPELKGKQLLVLWGGEDISPSIYKQEVVHAHATPHPSRRDQIEINLVKAAIQEGIPILGICRGAQMLCALGGGSLYQHVEHHGSHHTIHYKDREVIGNSCHHQMMIPTEEMQVLGYTKCLSPNKWMDQPDPITALDDEPEIVYMPKMKAIGVQGHPEWMAYDSQFVQLVRTLTGELLHVEI